MISVENLVKQYGRTKAVDGISFEVRPGEVVGFLGPNGAGKSTTLRILAGYLGATSGVVRIAGFDLETHSIEARRALGYMPEAVPLYPEMRVVEYLRFRAELKGVPRADRAKAVGNAMEKAVVSDRANTMIGHLSKGYRQRVGLADALVASPRILILDEPTAGLDPNQIMDVRALIRSLGTNHAVLLSTHLLGEVEATCHRVLVLAQGKLVAEGTPEELASKRQGGLVLLTVRGEQHAIERALQGVPHGEASSVTKEPGRETHLVRFVLPQAHGEIAGPLVETLVAKLVDEGCGIQEVRRQGSALEDVFSLLTTRVEETLEEAPERVTRPEP